MDVIGWVNEKKKGKKVARQFEKADFRYQTWLLPNKNEREQLSNQ
jgi:hypothetical protein